MIGGCRNCQAGRVPTDPSPAPRPVMPPSARVAVGVLAVLALLLLSSGLLLWAGFDVAADRVVDEAEDVSREEAGRYLLLLSLLPALVAGTAAAVAAVFLVRRRPWARWTGLAATGFLAVFTLVTAVLSGGVPVTSLLLLVLSIAGLTSLLAATTRDWLSGAQPPA